MEKKTNNKDTFGVLLLWKLGLKSASRTQLVDCLSVWGKDLYFVCCIQMLSDFCSQASPEEESARHLPLERRMAERIRALLDLLMVLCPDSRLSAIENLSCSLETQNRVAVN